MLPVPSIIDNRGITVFSTTHFKVRKRIKRKKKKLKEKYEKRHEKHNTSRVVYPSFFSTPLANKPKETSTKRRRKSLHVN